jgi:hypothetical protein
MKIETGFFVVNPAAEIAFFSRFGVFIVIVFLHGSKVNMAVIIYDDPVFILKSFFRQSFSTFVLRTEYT